MLLGCSLFLSRWWQHDRASRSNCRKSTVATVARPRRAATDMGGLCPCKASTAHPCHRSVCIGTEKRRRPIGFKQHLLSQLIVFASALNCRNSNNFGHGVRGFPPTRCKHYGTPVISTGRFFSLRWKLEVRTSIKPGVSFTSLGLHWFTPANQNDENENENNAVCTVYTRKPAGN
jgi:hypothetical protein